MSTAVDAEAALHYLRACLNKYPPYTEPLSDGRPRMVPWERLTEVEKSAQLQAMQELLEWLAAPVESGSGVAGLGLPTCPTCGHEEEEYAHGHDGMEETQECSGCGKSYLCTMFSEVTFTCREIEA